MSWTHEIAPGESAVNLTTVMTNIVVDKSTDHATPLSPIYYSLFYFDWTLPDSNTRKNHIYLNSHHSGQNAVDSRGAAEWIRSKFDYCDDEYRRWYQTTLH